MGRPSGVSPADQRVNRDQKRRQNTFTVLANLDSEECFPPLVGIKGFQTVSPPGADIQVAVKQEFKLSNSREAGIISEAISLHSHLTGVCEDVLLDDKRIQTARLGKESIEIELQRVRKGPKPFNSAKMADLAACIQRLKGSNSSFMYKNGVGAGAKKYEAPVEVKKDDVYVEAIDEGEADGSDDYESGSSEEDDEVVETE
ncbi:hypothetical protein U1Q18_051168, partial [Sarracenia purpurea var. burkii]